MMIFTCSTQPHGDARALVLLRNSSPVRSIRMEIKSGINKPRPWASHCNPWTSILRICPTAALLVLPPNNLQPKVHVCVPDQVDTIEVANLKNHLRNDQLKPHTKTKYVHASVQQPSEREAKLAGISQGASPTECIQSIVDGHILHSAQHIPRDSGLAAIQYLPTFPSKNCCLSVPKSVTCLGLPTGQPRPTDMC